MAEVRPLRALHDNLAAVSLLANVTTPPYDVIGPDDRCALLERSPFKGVEIDLPLALGEAYPYKHAA